MLSARGMTIDSSKRHYYHYRLSSHLSRTTNPLSIQLQYSLLLTTVSILCCIIPVSQAAHLCTVSNVINASMCTSGESFHNVTVNCCQRCSSCPTGYEMRTPCSTTSDTYCVPSCPHQALAWNEGEEACVIKCSFCSYECDSIERRCVCDPSLCYHPNDLYCDVPIPCTITSSRPTVDDINTGSGNPSSLPPWGIGVIAVGAVLGIVAFSAGFLLMGICTRKKRSEGVESGGSDNSESMLMSNGRSSRGTRSTYISGYPNQSLLDLLRNTNTPVHSSLSSIHSSPRSARASPCPERTLRVKPDNNLTSSLV